jgi:hypothetical protein
MSAHRIVELSNEVATHTKTISEFFTSKGLEAPSFDVNGLDTYPISPDDGAPFIARLALIDASKELHELALGPKESLRYLAWELSELPPFSCQLR